MINEEFSIQSSVTEPGLNNDSVFGWREIDWIYNWWKSFQKSWATTSQSINFLKIYTSPVPDVSDTVPKWQCNFSSDPWDNCLRLALLYDLNREHLKINHRKKELNSQYWITSFYHKPEYEKRCLAKKWRHWKSADSWWRECHC